jgi:hypothetical protein
MSSNKRQDWPFKLQEHDNLQRMMTMNLNPSSLCSTSADLTHECELFQQLVPGQFRIQFPDLDDSSHQISWMLNAWSLLPTDTAQKVSQSVKSWMTSCWSERQRHGSLKDGEVANQSSRSSFL